VLNFFVAAWRRERCFFPFVLAVTNVIIQMGKQTLFWSDADSKMRIAFPILMINQGGFTF
jgi:hypothetical protein